MSAQIAEVIRTALERDGITVAYQPICDLGGNHHVAWWEALARCDAPGELAVDPVRIVNIARRHGLLDELTRQVLDHAFATIADVRELAGPTRAGRGFTVNLEASQLQRWGAALDSVVERSRDSGINVMVEITERGLDAWTPAHRAVTERLREAGISLAIDDFGTGYAALGSLFHAPVDTIKIDRSMAASLSDPRQRILLERIITTLHELDFSLVVEGVDSASDLDDLMELGVEFVQGHLLAEPMTHDAVLEWARRAGTSPNDATFQPQGGWSAPLADSARSANPLVLTWRERARLVREGDASRADAPTADAAVMSVAILDAILHGSFDGIVLWDRLTGEYLEVSDSFCELTGYARSEILGRTSTDLKIADPDGALLHPGAFKNTIVSRDGTHRAVEFTRQSLAGEFDLVIIREVTDPVAE